MQIPLFYNFDDLLIPQWFEMLTDFDDAVDAKKTHVYRLETDSTVRVNGEEHPKGIYFLRAAEDDVYDLKSTCSVEKLPFSEIVYLSDIFSRTLNEALPDENELEEVAIKGEASKYFDREIGSTEGLKKLSDKIQQKYFDHSIMGTVRRVFSALINFFRKYNLYIETGIYWPGDSCAYAEKVIKKIDRLKLAFLHLGVEASKEQLSKILGLTIDELEEKSLSDLKKLYHGRVLDQHPDKTPKGKGSSDKFQAINRVWGDYNELLRQINEAEKADQITLSEIAEIKKEMATPFRMKAHANRPALKAPQPVQV